LLGKHMKNKVVEEMGEVRSSFTRWVRASRDLGLYPVNAMGCRR
jgi:hypothetical protein